MKKDKYFHVYGKAGMGFALWIYESLSRESPCIIVDCSKMRSLERYVNRKKIECSITDSKKLLVDIYSCDYVIFYHEQEDSVIDSYPGIHYFFVGISDVRQVNELLISLTDGQLRLFEKTLLPQLGGYGKIYVLTLIKKKVRDECIIYNDHVIEKCDAQEQTFRDIFNKSMGRRRKRQAI